MKTLMRVIIRGVTLLVVLTAVVIGYGVVMFNAPPFPLSRLEQLEPGISRSAVKKVLGKPLSTYSDGKGQTWTYSRGWPIVYVYFDQDRKMTHTVYDH